MGWAWCVAGESWNFLANDSLDAEHKIEIPWSEIWQGPGLLLARSMCKPSKVRMCGHLLYDGLVMKVLIVEQVGQRVQLGIASHYKWHD